MRLPQTMLLLAASVLLTLSGCASHPVQKVDYTAFKQAQPRSLLVLPPLNDSPDVTATPSLLSVVTYPLAESGYYVMPVALMSETFRQNGMVNPPEIHSVSPAKLKEIFGADAALYIKINRYGTTYTVLNSAAIVTAEAKLVDLGSGNTLWTGSATASSAENNNNNQGGLAGLLIAAIVKQIINSTTDVAHQVAGVTSSRLLSAGHPNGLLYGPRSPKYGTDGQ